MTAWQASPWKFSSSQQRKLLISLAAEADNWWQHDKLYKSLYIVHVTGFRSLFTSYSQKLATDASGSNDKRWECFRIASGPMAFKIACNNAKVSRLICDQSNRIQSNQTLVEISWYQPQAKYSRWKRDKYTSKVVTLSLTALATKGAIQ